MATYIQNLVNGALGDGARATKFDADIFFTNVNLFDDNQAQRTLIKTMSFPGKNHDIIDFKYKGRSIPIKGQVKYNQTWTCSFYLTEDHKLKNALEVWLESLDPKHNYTSDTKSIAGLEATQKANASGGYTSNILLFQRNFDNTQITAEYYLYNVFPIEISPVEASADAVGQVQEFSVTFAYSYYEMGVVKGDAGNFIDKYVDKAIATAQGAIDEGLASINKLSDDAVGSAGDKILALLDNNISDLFGSVQETAKATSEQIAQGAETMQKTIDDVLNDN